MLLRRWVSHLARLDSTDPWLTSYEWWIVPHANPDGEEQNSGWQTLDPVTLDTFDPVEYLAHAVRESPGHDLEFGFPRDEDDHSARPETRALSHWWSQSKAPCILHASLHGMSFASGPWFLIDPTWIRNSDELRATLIADVHDHGYEPRDIDRQGEKGFVRIGPGFSTWPSSSAMRAHFEGIGDPETARLFRPNSMETIRAHSPSALTIVSECPLFYGPEQRFDSAARAHAVSLARGSNADRRTLRAQLRNANIRPMPSTDQLSLVGRFVLRSLNVADHRRGSLASGP